METSGVKENFWINKSFAEQMLFVVNTLLVTGFAVSCLLLFYQSIIVLGTVIFILGIVYFEFLLSIARRKVKEDGKADKRVKAMMIVFGVAFAISVFGYTLILLDVVINKVEPSNLSYTIGLLLISPLLILVEVLKLRQIL